MKQMLTSALLVMHLGVGGLAFAAPLAPTVPVELPADPAAAAAVVQQQVLPSLQARVSSADARAAAARGYFSASVPFPAAFPDLEGLALDDPAVLEARLQRLDDAGAERASARIAELPTLPPELGSQLARSLTAALDAEDAADALQRRVLLALRRHVEEHPKLSSSGLAGERQRLDGAVTRARRAMESASAEAKPAARRELARVEDERRELERLVKALQRRATVPGAPIPDATEALAQAATSASARDRLMRLSDFLSPAQAADVHQTQQQWLETGRRPTLEAALASLQEAPPPGGDLEALKAALPDLRASEQAAAEALARATVPSPTALDSSRGAIADLEHQIAALRVAKVEEQVRELEAEGGAPGLRARIEADRAARVAKEARAAAAAALDAELVEAVVEAKERTGAAWDRAIALRESQEQLASEQVERVKEISGRAANARGGLLVAGQQHADTVYRDLRGVLDEQRRVVDEATDRLREGEKVNAEARDAAAEERVTLEAKRLALSDDQAVRAEQRDTLSAWEQALDSRFEAIEASESALRDGRTDAVRTLRELREVRRSLMDRASSSVVAEDNRPAELQHEVTLLGVQVRTMVGDRITYLLDAPSRMRDLSVLWQFASNSFYLLLLAGLWLWARDTTGRLAGALLVRARRLWPHLRPADLHKIREPGAYFLRDVLDWCACLLFLGPLWSYVPELGLVVFAWLHVVFYRMGVGFFELAVSPASEDRPSPWTVGDGDYQAGRTTIRWLLLWWIGARFIHVVAYDLLGTDAISSVVGDLVQLLGIGLGLVLLHRWEPLLRVRVRSFNIQHVWVKVLADGPPQSLLQAVWACGHLLLLASRLAWALLLNQAGRSRTLAQALNVLTRYRFSHGEEVKTGEPLDPEALASIAALVCGDDSFVDRTEADESFANELAAWQREQRRGLIAVIGDRGDGKRVWLDRVLDELDSNGTSVTRVKLSRRVTSKAELFAWLVTALELKDVHHTEDMAEVLRRLPPGVIVLEQAHFAFLRTVGGLEAMRKLLYVLNAASQEHLWVISIHRPAWRYLQRLGSLVDTGIMRAVIDLAPLSEQDLQELTLKRTRPLGQTVDFSLLVRPSALGGDPEIELERTTDQYYRLLGEASGGNPAAALAMFGRCLRASPDGRWMVTMDEGLEASGVEGLSEMDLFVLTAIRTHDELDEMELVKVLNMGQGTVRSTVKSLQSRGLLEREGTRARVPVQLQPSITRALRRRHFLQWAV